MSVTDLASNDIRQAVEAYSDMLLRVAFTYMGSLSDAEDMVQAAFLKLVLKSPSFNSEEHRKAWLIRVTLNECKSSLRSAWFRKTAPLNEAALGFSREESDVLKTVMELPEMYRYVILLYYHEGYSIREIADLLGSKESTVSSRLQRARQKLKLEFEGDDDLG